MKTRSFGLASSLFVFLGGWSVAVTAAPEPTSSTPTAAPSTGTSWLNESPSAPSTTTQTTAPAPAPVTASQPAASSSPVVPSAASEPSSPPSPAPVLQVAPAASAPHPAALRDEWHVSFDAAKSEFLLGHFSAAETQFLALLVRAPSPEDKARVEELLSVTREWTRRGSALLDSRELQGSEVLSRRTDKRTADEIGVLYFSGITYGLGTGFWLSTLGEAETIAGWVLPPLAMAGASAGAVALLDRGAGLRYGTAQSIASGMWLGLWQGIAWGGYYQETARYYNEMDEKGIASVLFATTTAGALTGGLVGTYRSTTPGRAAFVGSASIWPATVLGLGVAAIVPDDEYRGDRALLSAAIGLTAGSVAGMLYAGEMSPTTARVRFLDLGGVAGGLALGGITLAASGEDSDAGPEATMAMTSVGAIAGIAAAWWLTSDMPKDLGAQSPQSSAITFVPTVVPQRGGMNLGLAGAF